MRGNNKIIKKLFTPLLVFLALLLCCSDPVVGPIRVTGVSLSEESLAIKVGKRATLTALVTPENADNKDVIWTSTEETVATVSHGSVEALSVGQTIVIVSTVDGGKTAICKVAVDNADDCPPPVDDNKGSEIIYTSIDNGAFGSCMNLALVNIPDSVTSIGSSAFKDCGNIRKIELPRDLKEIADYCFCRCLNLVSIELPDELTVIGRNSFAACVRLSRIDIPEKVTSIDNYAFSGCSSLERVNIMALSPPKLGGTSVFPGKYSIYVPFASLDAYKSNEDWQTYKDRLVGY
jgi:hypothetical protein